MPQANTEIDPLSEFPSWATFATTWLFADGMPGSQPFQSVEQAWADYRRRAADGFTVSLWETVDGERGDLLASHRPGVGHLYMPAEG
jgi:hypothetical protein